MALIFPRLAQNFIKNGYFPTDEVTLERIISALDIDGERLRVLDPCCGEGTALAEIGARLVECGAEVETLGVEFDKERAWHAKRLLGKVLHADVNDVFMSARAAGLLFLNPPYGHGLSDQAGISHGKQAGERLELQFMRKTAGWLATGGVLVLVVPHYTLTEDMAMLIAKHFENVSCWMAPEQRFKQAVIFGVKRRSPGSNAELVKSLTAVATGDLPPELPENWTAEPYLVPQAADEFRFNAVRLNGAELSIDLEQFDRSSSTLWSQFTRHFDAGDFVHRPPLRQLSSWHLALALAAGQIGGFVTSRSGRTLLIKGATYKGKKVAVEHEERDNGSVVETRIATDVFVPTIQAIDFTEGSEHYGLILTIK
jgi:tRNA1(Val) A37 N6-methylase TrmN6